MATMGGGGVPVEAIKAQARMEIQSMGDLFNRLVNAIPLHPPAPDRTRAPPRIARCLAVSLCINPSTGGARAARGARAGAEGAGDSEGRNVLAHEQPCLYDEAAFRRGEPTH